MALTDGLINGWNMNNDWLDAFGPANGTPNGAFFSTPAPLGAAQGEGDGIDDRTTFGSPISIQRDDPFSFSFILTPKDLLGTQVFLSTFDATQIGGMEIFTSAGSLFMRVAQNLAGGKVIQSFRAIVVSEQHVVCTYDGSNNASGINFYINNVSGRTISVNNPMDGPIIHHPLSFFARSNGQFAANMKMDAAYFWDSRVITAGEVSQLYNGGNYLELFGPPSAAGTLKPHPHIEPVLRSR